MSIELPRLSQDFYDAIFARDCDLMFTHSVIQETDIAPADAILALGYKDFREDAQILPSVGFRAAELFHAKLAPIVIVSGGVKPTFFEEKTEADVLKDILLDARVPRDAIIVEDSSTNTQENMVFSRDATKGLEIKSLISVGHAIYGRRILMTLAQNWPEISRPMMSNVWFPGFNQSNWMRNSDYFKEAVAQFERLDHYVASGFIKEIDLNHINARIRAKGKSDEPHRKNI